MTTPTAKELFLAEVSAYGLPNRHIEMWKACEAAAKAIGDLCEPLPIADNTPDLVAEVERMRGLIKEAEWRSYREYPEDQTCPWCYAGATEGMHRNDCPAFTPEGEVR